jgi:hypothetical protein
LNFINEKTRSMRVFFYVQEEVRPLSGREAGLGHVRYIAMEHMDVRRDCLGVAQRTLRLPGKSRHESPTYGVMTSSPPM